MFYYFSPLEQFDLIYLIIYSFSVDSVLNLFDLIYENLNIYIYGLMFENEIRQVILFLFFILLLFPYLFDLYINIYISNITIMFIIIFLFLLITLFYIKKKNIVFNLLTKFYEILYSFVLEIIQQQLSIVEIKYFPLLFFLFFFILFCNLFGMLPFGFTITAHLSITFFLAFSINFTLVLIGFIENGLHFLDLFVPKGTPKFLLPLIVVIEVVSYLIRTFSLSIRLFANMMAGHCLIFVISSFVFSLFNSYFLISLIPVIFIFFGIFCLEFAICFLQAYVFVILICIYLNDSLHPTH